ncbi:DMT family transporter [soil metagenome]
MPWVFVLIWSTGFVVARLGLPYAPPFTLLCMRYGLSVICLLALIGWAKPAWPTDPMQWLHLAITGALIQAAYLGGVWAAIKLGIGAGTAALIVGLQPVLTAVWVSMMSTRGGAARVTAGQWAGLALGLAGLTLVVWRKFGVGEITHVNLLMSIAALAGITIGTLYQKRFVVSGDPRTALTVQMAAALIVTLPLALFEHEPVVWHTELVMALAWSVLGLTMLGNSLLYLLIQRGAATSVTSLMYLVPPCTALMAWLMFDEPITASMVAGMALTAAGVFVVLRGASR